MRHPVKAIERKQSYIKRTAQKQKIKKLCTVLLFVFMMPYTLAVLFSDTGKETFRHHTETSEITVELSKIHGGYQVPINEYLLGALALQVPGDYQIETIKAQSVILYSACLSAGTENKMKQEQIGYDYLKQTDRMRLWKEKYEEYETKFRQAIQDTMGLVILYQDKPVHVPFFRLSNGRTRKVKNYPYCKSVECKNDVLCSEYLQKVQMSTTDFGKKVGINQTIVNQKIIIEKDEYNYVNRVQIGTTILQGEQFRMLFKLPSSCYSLYIKEKEIVIEIRGVGHGIGFDQYAANSMAEEGKDFLFLLQFFFQNINIEKIV